MRFWDFLFYLSFGVVITSSVQIAGVLLVFCYLVAPAVFGVMFAETIGKRLAISWTLGTLVSALGLLFSYDRPSGPTIMCFFALALIVAGLYKKLRDSQHPAVALAGALGIVTGVAYLGLFAFQRLQIPEHEHDEAAAHHEDAAQPHGAEEHGFGGGSMKDLETALGDDHANVRAAAALKLGDSKDPHAVEILLKRLQDPSDAVKENVARALTQLADPSAIPHLQRALQGKEEDPWVHFRLTEALASSGDPAAVGRLVELLAGKAPRLLRNEALGFLLGLKGQPVQGGTLDVESPEGKPAAAAIAAWWKEKGATMRFDKASRSYK
ncbi:MAG: HEAT repeat domain-containing protein [Candidatus Wallbacteria bacterium]|nr:HEAT repeat domain-containing protein [Candidatus Wallbacteria bacterium]